MSFPHKLLSLLLVLLLLPAAALATSPDVVENVTTGQTYATLAQAVTEAKEGNTLALRSDVALSKPLDIGKSLTLDLRGNTLNLANCSITMNAPGAALTLQATGGGISGSGAPCFDISAGTLNILSGTYQSDVAVISTVEGVITVSGGTLAGGTAAPETGAPSIATVPARSALRTMPPLPTPMTPAFPSTAATSRFPAMPLCRASTAYFCSIMIKATPPTASTAPLR